MLDRRAGTALASLAAFALPVIVFWPATRLPLLSWDDASNVMNNARLVFTADGLSWMWTGSNLGHWHPLTWMTLALDRAIWGGSALGYHLTNVLLHALDSLLLFLLARRLLPAPRGRGGAELPALACALLWALHPLRVESVAWVTERRDVLCAALSLACALAWVRGAEAGEGEEGGRWRLTAFALGAAALGAKIFAAVLPGVLLVLDARLRPRAPRRRLLLEKLPWVLPVAVALAFNVRAQIDSGSAISLAGFGLRSRALQAAYDLAFGVVKTVWPSGLCPYYDRSILLEGAPFLIALVVVPAVAALLWVRRRRWPALAQAAAAYAVLALPALGLFKSGRMIAADRYVYLPGLPLALLAGAAFARVAARPAARTAALAVLSGLALLTRRQIPVWRSDEALWTSACACSPLSFMARIQLSLAIQAAGRDAEGTEEMRRALLLRREVFDRALRVYEARGDAAAATRTRAQRDSVSLVPAKPDPPRPRARRE